MSRIPQALIDQLLQTAQIAEVVADFVTLIPKGTNLWANCPFHEEKSPSFAVNPKKGNYKCFGCGKGGGAVQFIMEIKQISYPAALHHLARKYSISLEVDPGNEAARLADQERESLALLTARAVKWYRNELRPATAGQHYLTARGLDPATLETFAVGYAPAKMDALFQGAIKAGYSEDVIEKCGLVIYKTDGEGRDTGRRFDRFRDRIMFPFFDAYGKAVGFGGRTLKEYEKVAKYLNSPESPLYHKSQVLYGLFQAQDAVRAQKNCYMVEGYMDVLSLHQGGVKNVVATAGTALGEKQIALLKRYTPTVTVLYDGDAAGLRASLRNTELLLWAGLRVYIVLLPDGQDPDSFIRTIGPQDFAEYLDTHRQDFLTFQAEMLLREVGSDPVGTTQAVHQLLATIARVPDAIQRQLFVEQITVLFGLAEPLVLAAYSTVEPGPGEELRTGSTGFFSPSSSAGGNDSLFRQACHLIDYSTLREGHIRQIIEAINGCSLRPIPRAEVARVVQSAMKWLGKCPGEREAESSGE